ncbi:MAG TPA: nitroreductase/quinone reductase family protein [Acidimicrobiia bacterium]|nr:nitroreductase/quinone reductase family protein [Acidimicrobiia bacterium]
MSKALSRGGIVDITTTGRRTGQPHRMEIYLHSLDGSLWLTGKPGFPRDWVANLSSDPSMTIHLKNDVKADVPAFGTVITDPEDKAKVILQARVRSWGADPDQARAELDHWAKTSPLVKVQPAK